MRMISAALAVALVTLLPLGARAQDSGTGRPDAAERSCQSWDHGQDALQHGWTLTELKDAERGALLRYYDKRVAARADPDTDAVVVARHPDVPLVRVIITRGDCIVDIGQMSADALDRILHTGTPV